LRAAGHDVEAREVFVMYTIYVGADDAQARAEVADCWHRWRGFALEALGLVSPDQEAHQRVHNHLAYDSMVRDGRGIFGGPETCARMLSQERVLKSMERFAREVRRMI
jgi:alkanesulfonate monooxygenase SsuD/methylene tetrahydromethanopterin reductase-like flavin-dependent oxidoreductase (luciferase family)